MYWLVVAPFVVAIGFFLIATRTPKSELIRRARIGLFVVLAVASTGIVNNFIDEIRSRPTNRQLYIAHEYVTIESCEPDGTATDPTSFVTVAFTTNDGYAHPPNLYRDKNYFDEMRVIQFGARVITEDGERNFAQDYFDLPLDGKRVAKDTVFRATLEVAGHGRCEIDLFIARKAELIRPG